MEYFFSRMLVHARSIWQQRWYAMAMMWCVAAIGFLIVYSLPSQYQSSARVYVDTQSILKPLLSGMATLPNVQQQVQIMSRTLLSRPNVERVIRMADLDVQAKDLAAHERLVAHLQSQIKVGATGSQDIYTISYTGHNAAQARTIVQAFLTLFVEGSFTGKRGDTDQAVKFLDQQIAHYEARLLLAENSLKEFKLRHAGLLPRAGTDYSAQLASATDALGAAQLELAEAREARQAILSEINGGRGKGGGAGSNVVLEERLAEVSKQLETLRMQYTEQHPDVIAARRLLAQLEARRRQEAKRPSRSDDPGRHYSPMLQQLKVALAEADARVAAIGVRVYEFQARLQRLQQQSLAAPEVEAQLAQLNRDYAVNKEQYEKLASRRESARLSGDLNATTEMMTFKIIDPPSLASSPAGPNRPWLYSLVMLGALGCGAATALAITHVRPGFGSAAELREVTGLPVLGSIAMHDTADSLAMRARDHRRLAVAATGVLMLYGAVLVFGRI